ncbi:hypothetical protein TNCV_417421 [Trichonephila clavipes]|nr:hypothetical protein TNCV_417421 [Trichonephila clavipes]
MTLMTYLVKEMMHDKPEAAQCLPLVRYAGGKVTTHVPYSHLTEVQSYERERERERGSSLYKQKCDKENDFNKTLIH